MKKVIYDRIDNEYTSKFMTLFTKIFKDEEPRLEGNKSSLLSKGCKISGNIETEYLRIEGVFEGVIDSKKLLITADGSEVNAEIIAKDVVLGGKFSGSISASGVVKLTTTAEVQGSIECDTLHIEGGAMFNGHCRQDNPKKSLLPVKYNPVQSFAFLSGLKMQPTI